MDDNKDDNPYLTPDKWDLDFYKPTDLIGTDPNAQFVNRNAAVAANAAGKSFFEATGKRVGVNLEVPAGPNGAGTRRGTRSPGNNPGASGSRHLHGDAFDFQIQELNDDERGLFLEHLQKNGFKGYGFYSPEEGGHLHADMGRQRTWSKKGIPLWAASRLQNDKSIDRTDIPYETRSAIDYVAAKSGIDKRMLYSIAYAESGYDPRKRVGTSSAKGVYQMTDGNWKYLTGKYAKNYPEITSWDRDNPLHNSLMMVNSIAENQAILKEKLGRDPSPGETYGAHFLGASGFSRFIDYSSRNLDQPAANGASEAAVRANYAVFFNKSGKPRTAREVLNWMDRKASNAPGFDAQDVKLKSIIAYAQDGYKGIPGVGAAVDAANGKVSPATANADTTLAVTQEMARRKGRTNAVQNGVAAQPSNDVGYRKIDQEELYAPPAITSRDISKVTEEAMNHRETVAPMYTLAMDALRDTQTLSWMFAGAPGRTPDPSFMLNQESAKRLIEGVDPRYHAWVLDSYSEEQALAAREDALRFMEGEKRLDEAGLTGMGLRLASAFVDPVTMLAAIGTAGAVAPYVYGGKTLNAVGKFRAGLLAGTANVGATAVYDAAGDPRVTGQDYLISAVAGFGLGALAGRSAKVAAENETLAHYAAQIMEDIEKRSLADAGSSSAGAAQNLDAPFQPASISKAWDALKNEDVWKSGVGDKLPLIGSVERTMQSKNPAARLVAPYLGEYAIGMKGFKTNPIAASERAKRLEGSFNARYADGYKTNFTEYVKENGGNWVDKYRLAGEFSDKVGLAIRETDPAVLERLPKSVRAMAETQKAMQKEILDLARNPGKRMGKELAPVQGFDTVADNPNYLYRVWDASKLHGLGQEKLERILRGALRTQQPTLDEKYIRRLAKGASEKMINRTHGLDDTFERAMTGGDSEALRSILRGAGMDEEEIQDAVKALTKPSSTDSGNPSRSKRRMLLNENYETVIDGEKVKLSDYLVNDSMALFRAYNRQMSSRISLAQTQIMDPKTGELILDGIRSDADFEALIKQVRAKGAAEGQTPREMNRDELQLRFIYDYMTGRLKMPDNNVMDALRLVQKFNFVRVMNQVGFAQIPEMATTVAQVGWKAALEHMPEVRRIVGMKAEHLQRHGFLDEMEYVMGQSTAMLKSHITSRFDDEATNGMHAFTKGRAFDKAEAGLENLQRVTSTLSGMNGLTDMIQNWNSKIVGQHFVNLAYGAKEVDGKLVFSNANMRRIRSLGIETEKTSKYRYKNPAYKGVDMVALKKEYDAAVDIRKKATLAGMDPEARKTFDTLRMRLDDMGFNKDLIREEDIPQVEEITKQMDEIMTKADYKPPVMPQNKGAPKFIEGEATMLERITRQIKEHSTTTEGTFNQRKYQLMNYNAWSDLEAREAFIDTLFRASRRMVQENDVGQLASWMSHPMARVLLQFRTFMVGAYSKQLLHNLHMSGALGGGFDRQNAAQTFTYFSASVVMGGLVYAAQSKVQAIGRSDADEWLYDEEKGRLSPGKLAAAAVQRAGWSSIIPLVMDTANLGKTFTGDPLFDARTTGQPSDAFFGNPTAGLFDSVAGIGPAVGSMVREGRSPTQGELRKAMGVLPLQNLLGVQQMFNYMISDFDETKPR